MFNFIRLQIKSFFLFTFVKETIFDSQHSLERKNNKSMENQNQRDLTAILSVIKDLEKKRNFQEALKLAEEGAQETLSEDLPNSLDSNIAELVATLIRLNHRMAQPDRVIELKSLIPFLNAYDRQIAFDSLLLVSYAFYRKGDYPQCLKILEQAQEEVPRLPLNQQGESWLRIQTKKALTYRLNQNSKRAVDICQMAIRSCPIDSSISPAVSADFFRVYGWVLFNTSRKNLDLAKVQLEKSINLTNWNDYNGTGGDQGEVYYTYGTVLYQIGEYEKSFQVLRCALKFMESEYGEQSVELCNTLNQLGAVFSKLGMHEEAANSYSRSYIIREQTYSKDNLLTSISLENWLNETAALSSTGDNNQELDLLNERYQELYFIRTSLYEKNPISNAFWLAQAEHSYAQWMMKQDKSFEPNSKILNLFLQARDHYHEANKYGMEGICLKNLGIYYSKFGLKEESLKVWREALPLIEEQFGFHHPATKEIKALIGFL